MSTTVSGLSGLSFTRKHPVSTQSKPVRIPGAPPNVNDIFFANHEAAKIAKQGKTSHRIVTVNQARIFDIMRLENHLKVRQSGLIFKPDLTRTRVVPQYRMKEPQRQQIETKGGNQVVWSVEDPRRLSFKVNLRGTSVWPQAGKPVDLEVDFNTLDFEGVTEALDIVKPDEMPKPKTGPDSSKSPEKN